MMVTKEEVIAKGTELGALIANMNKDYLASESLDEFIFNCTVHSKKPSFRKTSQVRSILSRINADKSSRATMIYTFNNAISDAIRDTATELLRQING